MANDSSIALKDRDAVAQMTATYNYSRLQKEAHENEVKAYKTLLGLVISAAVAVLALVAAFLVWKRFRRKYQQEIMQLKTEYANASYEYEENLRELQLLESAHQKTRVRGRGFWTRTWSCRAGSGSSRRKRPYPGTFLFPHSLRKNPLSKGSMK